MDQQVELNSLEAGSVASMVSIQVEQLTPVQTLHEILNALLRIEGTQTTDTDAQLLAVAAQVRANTEALSSITSNPPITPVAVRRSSSRGASMSESPFDVVTQALADQASAIADLTSEIAAEHEQWVAAMTAGDVAQAQAVSAQIAESTAKLRTLSDELAASVPGAAPVEPPAAV